MIENPLVHSTRFMNIISSSCSLKLDFYDTFVSLVIQTLDLVSLEIKDPVVNLVKSNSKS